ncbi:hypothetical protein [Effusibacillus consociatus]|uniref:Aminotransferase class I/classII domain-containing protein n=1 Tax=Effusibacillus consociatus TaxID=1117041 RepID=A0ABV9PZ66_9BACL
MKELPRFMLEKAKVAMNEGRGFGLGGEGFMRMNIACPRLILEQGLGQIRRAVNSLYQG